MPSQDASKQNNVVTEILPFLSMPSIILNDLGTIDNPVAFMFDEFFTRYCKSGTNSCKHYRHTHLSPKGYPSNNLVKKFDIIMK